MSKTPGFSDLPQPAGRFSAARDDEELLRGARDGLKHLRGPGEARSGPGGVVLIGLVRSDVRNGSEAERFLEHHLSLGVRHAVLVTEAPAGEEAEEAAKGHESVTVFSTDLSVETHGGAIRRSLEERFGDGGWVLHLEASETFDYPYSEIIGLDSLIEYLERKSYAALEARKLDTKTGENGAPEEPGPDAAKVCPLYSSALAGEVRTADLTGVVTPVETYGGPGESKIVGDLVENGLLEVSESYMTWVDRKETGNPPAEALRERPFRLAEAFCRERSRRESRSESLQSQESRVEELEKMVSAQRDKANSLQRKARDLQRQLDSIRSSRVWRALGALASLKNRPSRNVAPPEEETKAPAPAQRAPAQAASANRARERTNFWIKRLRDRMYVLGFVERTIGALADFAADDSRPGMQRLAARELCLLYADRYDEEPARRCLELLPVARKGERHPLHLRQSAIIEAESRKALGDDEGARAEVSNALDSLGPHTDLLLAGASLEDHPEARVGWINRALRLHGIAEISLAENKDTAPLDSLEVREPASSGGERAAEARISVIVPVYNAQDGLRTALDSVLSQSWANLEVLVADDASTDGTPDIVREYERRDARVHLIRAQENRGTYVTRNLALREATGDFVTCHDSDDWSHPEKITRQAEHLLDNPQTIANTSEQARATPELRFYHRGKIHFLLGNGSSLMFRREPVMEKVGYWDCVRFGGDGEFKRRLKRVFGKESVIDLPTGPLSITRQSGVSLTESEDSGVYRPMGARSEYREVYTGFHETSESLRYDFPQRERPFVIPEPMWPVREEKVAGRRHFDVILASDFRLPGGTTSSNVEEIKAHKRMGLRTGLVQMARYYSMPDAPINPKIRNLMDGDQVQRVVNGEKVSCDVLILRHPPVLQEFQDALPDVETPEVQVIVNQTPMRDYSEEGKLAYEIGRSEEHLQRHFGRPSVWHPIGPLVREAMHSHHAAELPQITLAEEDWANIIDVEEWRRETRPSREHRPRIGRHSRDSDLKWPSEPEELLAAYPASENYEVHVLGGAEAPKELLGGLPENWRVLEFGEVHPREFLATLDVFVYYTHPDLVEAFGRTIIEAMAVGVPAILPHDYREVFGEAAIYAQPAEVKEKIDELMADDATYDAQVETARAYVEEHFGYTKHAQRLSKRMR